MAQKLGSITQWNNMADGQALEFPGDPRTVAFEVNSPEPIDLYMTVVDDAPDGPGEYFLAHVEGRDRIEVTVPGDFTLTSSGGEMWYFTTDGSTGVNVADPADPIFTTIANRKDRNPNIEAMEWRMRQNQERRFAEMEEEHQRRLADVVRTYTRPPVAVDAGEEPEQDGEVRETGQQPKSPPSKGGKDAEKSGPSGKPVEKQGKAADASDD